MRTILVIYTHHKLSPHKVREHLKDNKAYAFNTEVKVKVGTIIKSPKYATPMQVVEVLSSAYKYFNSKTNQVYKKATESFFESRISTLRLQKQKAVLVDGIFY